MGKHRAVKPKLAPLEGPVLPASLRQFVAQQKTMPVCSLWKNNSEGWQSPYGTCWYRAVACILLSGRVSPKYDGVPNMMDINRFGKEANFNQYLTQQFGTFLVAMNVIQFDCQRRYEPGPNLDAFWDHDARQLPEASQIGVVRLFGQLTGTPFWSNRSVSDQHHLIVLVSLFYACFHDRALLDITIRQAFQEFARLPEADLIETARQQKLKVDAATIAGWRKRLDAKGQKALVEALYYAEWAYSVEHEKTRWFAPSPTGLAMLGLGPMLPAPELATTFKAGADLSVFAGAGLRWEQLVPLFRYGTVKHIDQVFEFKLDRRRLSQAPKDLGPGKELKEALHELEPLPSAIEDLLATKSQIGGKLGMRYCSAIVKPESDEVLTAIRKHPRLKGYIEPLDVPGYLLIKAKSGPDNFIFRCRELGFDVSLLK